MRSLPASPRIVVLAGGVGGARMALGFDSAVPRGCLTVIVNVGDDDDFHGLRVCPDLDTVVYTLSGKVNKEQAWGVARDTTRALEILKCLGVEDAWMTLGDADTGLHLYRTARLRAGACLTEVTREICGAFGLSTNVLPVSDCEIRTTVLSSAGRLYGFQEWFVAHRAEPQVADLHFEGAAQAPATAEVVRALQEADLRGDIVANGMRALVTPTRIPDRESATALARGILAWSTSIAGDAAGGDA